MRCCFDPRDMCGPQDRSMERAALLSLERATVAQW